MWYMCAEFVTGLVKKLTGICIGGWSSACQPYIESLIMNKSQEMTVLGGSQKLTSAMKQRPEKL